MPELTNINYIQSLCGKHGFSLSKGFGQNFIINPAICPRMIAESGIDQSYGVLEIGPGIGVLTKEAARAAAKVVAVEVDTRLPALLSESLAEFDNVKIVLGDVLKTDLAALIREEFSGLKV
ncbi:MAG: rRNA adenine N-6-methyltransferase family protein, partial [Pygmaiobacter sp.]